MVFGGHSLGPTGLPAVVKPKFVCLTHSEAKQPKSQRLEQKGLLRGQAKRTGGWCSKNPNSLMAFREDFLKAKFGVRAAGRVTFFWLVGGEVTGRCSRNLGLSLKLSIPSSTLVGALVLQKNSKILLCLFLEEEPGHCPKYVWTAPPLFLYSLTFLISNCLNLPFGTQRRSWRLNEAYCLQTRNRGHGKVLYVGALKGPAGFHYLR